MKVTKLLDSGEDRAVSPVIGVILMVAITVILAAVIGTFVLGLGDSVQQTAPNAQFNWDNPDDTTLDLTHEGGQSIEPERLEVKNSDSTTHSACTAGDWSGGTSKVTAGSTCNVESGNTVTGEYRLVWTAQDDSQSSTLTRYDSA